jgi:hypothetical protein
MKNTRRDFIKKTAGTSALIAVGGIAPGFTAKSYGRIIGANEKIRVSVGGVNSRGFALAKNFAHQKNCDVIHVCDVDKRAITKCIKGIEFQKDVTVQGFGDFRKSLESKDVDVFVIAMPDHWHAPASLLALQAGIVAVRGGRGIRAEKRGYRSCLFRQGMVCRKPGADWHGQGSCTARLAELGSMAGTCPEKRV